MSVTYDYNGKVAVVTGGSAGIGKEITLHLVRAGVTAVVWDLNEYRCNQYSAGYIKVDVCDGDNVSSALDKVLSDHGKVDFLINSAGYAGPTVSVDQYDPEEWRHIVDVNLVGVFETCRQVLKQMRKDKKGRIVNISSLAGKEGTPNASAYSAAKAGVIALTKSMGKEFADYDIRINTIAPAAVKTAILDQMSAEHVQTMIDKSPQHRLGTVDEVAELTMWLCSDRCTFNSGAVFDLSGGRATY